MKPFPEQEYHESYITNFDLKGEELEKAIAFAKENWYKKPEYLHWCATPGVFVSVYDGRKMFDAADEHAPAFRGTDLEWQETLYEILVQARNCVDRHQDLEKPVIVVKVGSVVTETYQATFEGRPCFDNVTWGSKEVPDNEVWFHATNNPDYVVKVRVLAL